MPDAAFEDPRLAAVYDALDPDRSDLDAYVAMADEFDARRVLDVGCGTGTLAIRLARRGLDVTGVDPATGSVMVARIKPFADLVRWVDGDAGALAAGSPGLGADIAFMTANVAQVFVTDAAWAGNLAAIQTLLAPGGRLVFETRVPERRAWESWTGRGSDIEIPGIGRVSDSYEVLDVDERDDGSLLVTFRSPTTFHGDGVSDDVTIESTSTLVFRTRDQLQTSLETAGFRVDEVRDAPDRPGAEWVFVARRA